LDDLFPDADYGFRLRFEQKPAAEYFAPTERQEEILTQRRQWLESTPSRCVGSFLPEGGALIEETVALAKSFGHLVAEEGLSAAQQLVRLGEQWEPDFLLLRTVSDGKIRLLAGCVCFPSSWSLEEKIGRPIEEIHEPVPGLNTAIGPQIYRFLSKLRPGTAWLRSNWGLSRSPELNQHPVRRLPRLDERVEPNEVWMRVEDQALVALPVTGGILFGIRIANHPFTEILKDRSLSSRFVRALETMPEAVAQYKGIASARSRLLTLLTQ
jgi:hypothetical protein